MLRTFRMRLRNTAGYTIRLTVSTRPPQFKRVAGLFEWLCHTPHGNANPVCIKLGMVGGEHCSSRRGLVVRRVPR